MTTAPSSTRLSTSVCLGFGIGTVGVSIMLNAVTTYFPAFMSTVLGQSPQLAGYLLMISKLADAVVDVVIGSMSDRARTRWGRRKPFLMAGALLSAVSFLMLFSPPALGENALLMWMIAGLVIYSTAYSLFNVPYMALPAELTDGFHERTRLIGFRTVFVSIGQLLAMAVTAWLIQRGGGGRSGFATMGVVMALIIGGSMTATALAVPVKHGDAPLAGKHLPGFAQMRAIARNRPFMMLLGAKIFQFLSFASVASTMLLYMLNVLHVGYNGQIVFSVVQNVVTALAMPLWVWSGRTYGKRHTYLAGVVLFCLTTLSWLFADASITNVGIAIRGVFGGLGSGAIILMSISMLGDTQAYDRILCGEAREGLLSSAIAVTEKVSFALGVAVLGVFLNVLGYVPTTGGALVAQPASAMLALKLGFAVIPSAMFAINGLFLWAYDLDEDKLAGARLVATQDIPAVS
ncbi:major facilitator transporter [Novosphingobium sp. Rr 2-17]|uniref:MFS transporter n=1 Tax=Novosphingobium sp. Rr 2-17 TaxID=555793 RepID=UPI00026984D6|nr:MFS transporter [Novosphingobium sp. Rr 2-17]EIZ80525.1 major facilitator transporter [Novosphingobium sp. Rr 2-17]